MIVKGTGKFIRDFRTEATVALDKATKIKTKEIVNALKEATPVDTGEARDGWKVHNNHIENTVSHIENLNEGSSQQAPAFFIEDTVLKFKGVHPNGMITKTKS